MNIVKPYAKLLNLDQRDGIEILKKIEWAGRISHRSEDFQTTISWERFLKAVVLEHGDWSIVEHASATVDFLVDRGITHELVRHRLFSFTQESTRFVNYEKKMAPSFILPDDLQVAEDKFHWEECIVTCELGYKKLVQGGVKPQIARSVFPNALASRIIITGNLRNWRHFFIMRTTKESHPQMREVSIPLLEQFKETFPLLYDDIEPNARQIDNLRLPR